MAGIAGAAAVVILEVLRGSSESMSRDARSHDGRAIPWTTMLAASMAAALYAPWIAGSLLAFPLAANLATDDLLSIVGTMLLAVVAGLFGLALSFVFIGLAVGSAILVDRPGAWWYARAWAAMGLFFSWITLAQWGPLLDDARVIGWAMLAMAIGLFALALPPRGKPRPSPPRRRRFVL